MYKDRLIKLMLATACLGSILFHQPTSAGSSTALTDLGIATGSGAGMKMIYIAGDKSASYVAAACGMREVAEIAGAVFEFQLLAVPKSPFAGLAPFASQEYRAGWATVGIKPSEMNTNDVRQV